MRQSKWTISSSSRFVLPRPLTNSQAHFHYSHQLIIRVHWDTYKDESFEVACGVLLDLKDHFNQHKNLFAISKGMNNDKRAITARFLGGTPETKEPTGRLRDYFRTASPSVRAYLRTALPNPDWKQRAVIASMELYLDHLEGL